jgi:hypothetical protein
MEGWGPSKRKYYAQHISEQSDPTRHSTQKHTEPKTIMLITNNQTTQSVHASQSDTHTSKQREYRGKSKMGLTELGKVNTRPSNLEHGARLPDSF